MMYRRGLRRDGESRRGCAKNNKHKTSTSAYCQHQQQQQLSTPTPSQFGSKRSFSLFLTKIAMGIGDDRGLEAQTKDLIDKYFVEKKKIPIEFLGVHPAHRGSVYPRAGDVRSLASEVFKVGFDEDQANRGGICVMELSEEERPKDYETFKEFNCRHCEASSELEKCFDRKKDMCQYGLLSKNHIFLVLRCIVKQAALFTNPGGINIEDVRREFPCLGEILTHGLQMIVLRAEIMTEQPDACSLISKALNKDQGIISEYATTETYALACVANCFSGLSGAVIEKTFFAAVKEKMRYELGTFVEKDGFMDLYEFCRDQCGAASMQLLMTFSRMFVDSSKKRLPLTAFKDINKLPAETPRTRVAVLMRLYDQGPPKGSIWCPAPEPLWKNARKDHISDLEALLRYCDVDLGPIIARMERQDHHKFRHMFRMNFYTQAATAFALKKRGSHHRDALLQGIANSFDRVREFANHKKLPEASAADCEWIKVDITEQSTQSNGEPDQKKQKTEELVGEVITMNQFGDAEDEQDLRFKQAKAEAKHEIHWRCWRELPTTKALGRGRQDHASVTSVLEALWQCDGAFQIPLTVRRTKHFLVVTADEDIPAGKINFPPCSPLSGGVVEQSFNEQAVKVTVVRRQVPWRSRVEIAEEKPAGTTKPLQISSRDFYIKPEQKLHTTSDDVTCPTASLSGKESMSPAWLVPRLTSEELAKYNLELKPGARKQKFNAEWKNVDFESVVVGALDQEGVSSCITVTVPVLTNTTDLKRGDLLVMEKKRVRRLR
jgi:hypothetical protein